ncbi:hypothetical protein D3C87_1093030 [compost metagenome]
MARAHHHEIVGARQHKLDGLARAQSHQCRHRLHGRIGLAAERAADAGQDHANLRHRQTEDLGCRRLHAVHRLARRPDHDPAGIVDLRHRTARLHVAVHLRGCFIGGLDDHLGAREAMLDITLSHRGLGTDVHRQQPFEAPQIGGKLFVNGGSTFGQRIFRRQQRRKLLVLHLDELDGPPRRGQIDSRDRSDRLAHIAHMVPREHVLVLDERPVQPRKVGAGQDASDAWQARRARDVDPDDACMRVRRQQVGAMQHPRARDVVDIDRTAGDLLGAFETRNGFADGGVLTHRDASAAAEMASTMAT